MKKIIIAIAALSLLSACGTTSGMKTANAAKGDFTEQEQRPDFSMYSTIIVKDFGDGTKKQNLR